MVFRVQVKQMARKWCCRSVGKADIVFLYYYCPSVCMQDYRVITTFYLGSLLHNFCTVMHHVLRIYLWPCVFSLQLIVVQGWISASACWVQSPSPKVQGPFIIMYMYYVSCVMDSKKVYWEIMPGKGRGPYYVLS